jgi:hypothetical protein
MLYLNQLNAQELEALKQQILADVDNAEDVSDTELERELESLYIESNGALFASNHDKMSMEAFFLRPGLGKKIWLQIKKVLCAGLNEDATREAILTAILGALATVMPLGAIALRVVTWILRRFIRRGVEAMCGVEN